MKKWLLINIFSFISIFNLLLVLASTNLNSDTFNRLIGFFIPHFANDHINNAFAIFAFLGIPILALIGALLSLFVTKYKFSSYTLFCTNFLLLVINGILFALGAGGG
ncbi:Uncharacterised protein [Listeria grayi]|uniref:hypothetical protein n=1 Tax=Listeria grayi TaxID=1641 RepID=UPI000F70F6F7|nr:hypothetical protein [Listeria grayi]MBC1920922.1 hypothetical protein [Listeria grayi]VEI34742.1 Uncharacterised protein [Listeria grayi]